MQIIEKVFFRKKCHKFRVCRSTKVKSIYYWCPSTDFAMLPHQIILHDEPNVFTVDDGSGMSVKILTQSRECIAATFYRFLLNISGLPWRTGLINCALMQILFLCMSILHQEGQCVSLTNKMNLTNNWSTTILESPTKIPQFLFQYQGSSWYNRYVLLFLFVFVFLLIVLTVLTVFYYNLVGNGRNKIFHKGRLAETFCCDF